MHRHIFFKQISINKKVVNFKISHFSTNGGPFVFVNTLDDLSRDVFIMNPVKGKWKINHHYNFPMWLRDFEYLLSEAINDREI
jgi:hypothetical protein